VHNDIRHCDTFRDSCDDLMETCSDVHEGNSFQHYDAESVRSLVHQKVSENGVQYSPTFTERLADWAVKTQTTHSALDALIAVLKTEKGFQCLPDSSKTLLKTPKSTQFKKVHPGLYYHFGIEDHLKQILDKEENIPSCLDLAINIDGLPISKSSGSEFYPILGLIRSLRDTKPFVIGIYHGKKKPKDPNLFLSDFVNDL
jgi:hypothetical protein